MNNIFRNVLSSFKNKKILPVFLIDIIFIGVVLFLSYSYSKVVEAKYLAIGKTQEELQQILLAASEELVKLAPILQSFLLILLLGGLLLIVVLFILYSFSRAKIWNKLLNKELTKKNFWKWNSLNLLLILILLVYIIPVAVVKFITGNIFNLINNPTIVLYLDNIINSLLTLFFLGFVYLIYYNFTRKYLVWSSIGDSFNMLKSKWSSFYKLLLVFIVVNSILSLIFYYPIKIYSESLVIIIINFILIILVFSWFKTYFVSTLKK